MASSSGTESEGGPPRSQSKRMSRAQTMIVDVQNEDSSSIVSERVPSSLAVIAPILRVANEIEKDNPRVAYLSLHPSLRVAYVDEREETLNGKSQKFYLFCSLKGGNKLDEEIYRIKLPGPPTEIGEGKPENQNHAIIFSRGEALQTTDMNQGAIPLWSS